MSRAKRNWIQGAIKKRGPLHEALNVPEAKVIPVAKLEKAAHGKSPLLRKRATLALTLKKINDKKN
jgi:hypothetical protein